MNYLLSELDRLSLERSKVLFKEDLTKANLAILSNYVCAEAGELAGVCSKIESTAYPHSLEDNYEELCDEIADVFIRLHQLAAVASLDIENAVINKFNKVTAKLAKNSPYIIQPVIYEGIGSLAHKYMEMQSDIEEGLKISKVGKIGDRIDLAPNLGSYWFNASDVDNLYTERKPYCNFEQSDIINVRVRHKAKEYTTVAMLKKEGSIYSFIKPTNKKPFKRYSYSVVLHS